MAVSRSGDSEIPDLDNGLWERVRDAVQTELHADKSLWNGKLDYTTKNRVRGSASANGVLRLNDGMVVAPLQEMYQTRGQQATPEQWTQRRNALKTVSHEFSHLASPHHHTHADRANGMQDLSYKPIEEGVTEAWSQSAVDRVADRALPKDLADQIKAARNAPHSYPGWEPAARSFADQIGAEAGVDGDEVLRRMAAEPRTGKARAAADLLYDSSELPNLVPPAHEEHVRRTLAGRIDQGFANLKPLNENLTVSTRSVSAQRGVEIADATTAAVRDAETYYRNHLTRQQSQQLHQSTTQQQQPQAQQQQLPQAQQPPQQQPARPQQPTAQQPTQPRQPQPQQTQQQAVRPQQPTVQQQPQGQQPQGQQPQGQEPQGPQPGQGQRRDQDVAALRAVLDHQAPASGATRPRTEPGSAGRDGAASTAHTAARPTGHSAGHSTARTTDSPAR